MRLTGILPQFLFLAKAIFRPSKQVRRIIPHQYSFACNGQTFSGTVYSNPPPTPEFRYCCCCSATVGWVENHIARLRGHQKTTLYCQISCLNRISLSASRNLLLPYICDSASWCFSSVILEIQLIRTCRRCACFHVRPETTRLGKMIEALLINSPMIPIEPFRSESNALVDIRAPTFSLTRTLR